MSRVAPPTLIATALSHGLGERIVAKIGGDESLAKSREGISINAHTFL